MPPRPNPIPPLTPPPILEIPLSRHRGAPPGSTPKTDGLNWGHSKQFLLHQPNWQGSINVATAAANTIHSLLASNRPIPSCPHPIPTRSLRLGWVNGCPGVGGVPACCSPLRLPLPDAALSSQVGGGGCWRQGCCWLVGSSDENVSGTVFLLELFGLSNLVPVPSKVFPFACSF